MSDPSYMYINSFLKETAIMTKATSTMPEVHSYDQNFRASKHSKAEDIQLQHSLLKPYQRLALYHCMHHKLFH